jgi:hypothetical protein
MVATDYRSVTIGGCPAANLASWVVQGSVPARTPEFTPRHATLVIASPTQRLSRRLGIMRRPTRLESRLCLHPSDTTSHNRSVRIIGGMRCTAYGGIRAQPEEQSKAGLAVVRRGPYGKPFAKTDGRRS